MTQTIIHTDAFTSKRFKHKPTHTNEHTHQHTQTHAHTRQNWIFEEIRRELGPLTCN